MRIKQKDKARIKTDQRLSKIDAEINKVYSTQPALLSVEKKYAEYMNAVKDQTAEEYEAYQKDPEKKQEYINKVRSLTLQSTEYKRLVNQIVDVLAQVNQQALDVVNDSMADIYAINYDQVAEECKRVGIKINGKK